MLCVSRAVLSVVLGAWSVMFVGWADWIDCRCFLSFVFLGVAKRLEIPPCTTLGNDMFVVSVWHRLGHHVPADVAELRANAEQALLPKQIMRWSARR